MLDDLSRRRTGSLLVRPSERRVLALALAALAAGTGWTIQNHSHQIRISGVIIIVSVLASLALGMTSMLVLCAADAVALACVFTVFGINATQISYSGLAMIIVVLVVAVLQARRRDRLGLRTVSAEVVLAQIRDRLAVQSRVPQLPDDWDVQIEQRPADGAAICGDFVANRLVEADGRRMLHLALVDVSGSGISAGPRSLLLAGAVGGLLGSVEPDSFLAAANDYLMRQEWSLGFASAIYVVLDLNSGEYRIRIAGHPPAVEYRPAASVPWHTTGATGTVLGVMPELLGETETRVLTAGESLYLFTDGVVEDRTHDIDAGTQRLKDAVAARASADGWEGIAAYLIDEVPSVHVDDRTVVVVRRAAAATAPPLPHPDQTAFGLR